MEEERARQQAQEAKNNESGEGKMDVDNAAPTTPAIPSSGDVDDELDFIEKQQHVSDMFSCFLFFCFVTSPDMCVSIFSVFLVFPGLTGIFS